MAWVRAKVDNELYAQLKSKAVRMGLTIPRMIEKVIEWFVYAQESEREVCKHKKEA